MANRRWLITGVSSGLGKALAEAAIAQGDSVAGTARRVPAEDPLVRPGAGRSRLFALDVVEPDSVAKGVAAALDWLGGVDIVVNNAGSGMFGPVEVCSIDDFRMAMEVNYLGTVAVTKATLPALREARGLLVNVASMAAVVAMGGTGPYTASKHAVLGLTEALHEELAPLGVRVVAALPGGFRTDFWSARSNTIREGLADVYGAYPCGQIAARSAQHVGHEQGDPAKLAALLLALADHPAPPLYLVAGGDALALVEEKRAALARLVEAQADAAAATAFSAT